MTLHSNKSNTSRFNRLTLRCALGLVFVLGFTSFAVPAAQIKQEYFVRQGANESLLIRLSAFEAEIEASVFTPERKLLLSSAVPQSRLVPIFQFIDPASKSRQLELEVSSGLNTANSKFEIEFTRLSAWDNRSAALEKAYRLLSFGLQQSNTDNSADWTVKINSLMNAGTTFGQYGMLELRLWSAYFAAHLVQYRLHDYNLVLGLTREILTDTRETRWHDIELAVLQLRSAALIGLRRSGELRASASDPDPVQTSLLKTVQRADALGYEFEKAHAIRQSAVEYEDQAAYPQALEQFQLALQAADAIGDEVLAKSVRESLARIHAGQGDDPATNKVLQEIETQLVADGGGDELALNLLQQGRIFMRNYRYPEAIKELTQALGFQNDSSIRGQLNLELARAHFEIGQGDAMMVYLQAAGIDKRQASTYFDQSYRADIANVSSKKHDAESMYRKARSHIRDGRRGQALAVLEDLIDEVLFLRQSLPGVLGAWYSKRHQDLIESYLGLQLANGADSLLTLSKIRFSSKSPLLKMKTDSVRTLLAQAENTGPGEEFRQLDSAIKQELNTLRKQFNSQFTYLSKSGLDKHLNSLGEDEAVLTYHLTESAAYVWVAKRGGVQQRKLANPRKLYASLHEGVQSISMSTNSGFDAVMDKLGGQLLAPVSEMLPRTIYVVPAGLLLGFPFDALRVNGQYLVEGHTVANLMMFPSKPNPASSLISAWPQNTFLAGDPQDFVGSYASSIDSSAELGAAAEIFIGPGLHIIQGAALLADEFQSDHFRQADLVHLTMPGTIDPGDESHSRLQLSEPIRGLGRTALSPGDVRVLQVSASLVYLGATQVGGIPRSDVSCQLGFVSDFLLAGSSSVIAGLWAIQGESAEKLISGFYAHWKATGNVATALTETKRQYIQTQRRAGLHDWAAFQTFID